MGETRTRHFVTFLLPGAFFAEHDTRELEAPDVNEAMEIMPQCSYAFYLWDRVEIIDAGEVLRGDPKNKTGTYYPGAQLVSYKDIPATPDNHTLRENIKSNGLNGMGVKTRMGNWQWLQEGDTVLEGG